MKYSHPTVMKKEAIDFLVTKPDGIYVDATCGGGGHSEELLSRLPSAHLIACDWDLEALAATEKRLERFGNRVTIQQGNLGNIARTLKKAEFTKVDGILVDFGTSRHQIINSAGFSFAHDTFLDMRMSTGYNKVTASDIVAHSSEKELVHILREYGEERNALKIARAICAERVERPIRTTLHLANLIKETVPFYGKKIHPATLTFQALRIAVNKELDEIKSFLYHMPQLINPGGRLVAISFHSLEDRLIKHYVRENKDQWMDIGDGAISPSEEEIKSNPSSRSAKMRAIEKKSI